MAFPGLGNAISNSWKCRFQAPKTASVFFAFRTQQKKFWSLQKSF